MNNENQELLKEIKNLAFGVIGVCTSYSMMILALLIGFNGYKAEAVVCAAGSVSMLVLGSISLWYKPKEAKR